MSAISVCVSGNCPSCWQNLPTETSNAAEELKPEESGTLPEMTIFAPCLKSGQRA